MEDQNNQKSDKRKALEVQDVGESSRIDNAPHKKPRIEKHLEGEFPIVEEVPTTAVVGGQMDRLADNFMEDDEVLDEVVVPISEDGAAFTIAEPIMQESIERMEVSDILGNVNGSDTDLGYPYVHEEGMISIENNNTRLASKSKSPEKQQAHSQESNGEYTDNAEMIKKSALASSTLSNSDLIEPPCRSVNIFIKACDPKTGKLVYPERCMHSNYARLEVFLNQHNLSLEKNWGFNTGYSADVDTSVETDLPPPTSVGFKKPRITSDSLISRQSRSTLGSAIPRESIKTVFSDNNSPIHDLIIAEEFPAVAKPGKGNNKGEPKFTSTISIPAKKKIKKTKKLKGLSNGPSSNGMEKTPKTSKVKALTARSNSKSSTKKTVDKSSDTLGTPGKSEKKKKGLKSAKKLLLSSVEKSSKEIDSPRSATTSRSTSREIIRHTDSPLALISTSTFTVEPSPARAVAIVEGTSAKPLTKFEQEVNNEPVDIDTLKSLKTIWGAIAPNNPVFARWSDKNYYSGIVREKGLNDTWIIDFDDATTYPASEGHIIPIKILGVGTNGVYCPDSGYHPADAIVKGQKFVIDPQIGESVKYAIKLIKTNEMLWCTRRMLSIKDHDARLLRQEFQPTPKVLKAAEVSLENILPDSRGRRTASKSIIVTPSSKPSTPKSGVPPTSGKRIVGDAFDASTAEDSQNQFKNTPKRKTPKNPKVAKKKLNESTPPFNSSNSKTSTDFSPPSSMDASIDKKSTKESPKKIKTKDKEGSTLVFDGYQFFLTASGGGGDANVAANGPLVHYDKDEYRDIIENKGGSIIDTVGKEKGKEKTFLISDNYARTVKYIYCLAATIPCVSYKWVQECIINNKIVPWKTHELNAGWSLEENKLVPSHKEKPLQGFKIFITAGSDDLYNYWKPVLTAAEAKLLKPKKVKGRIVDDITEGAQVLVTDATCSSVVLDKAHELMIPVVKPEWLVQSIISGKRADFFNHEKYQVAIDDDYDEDDDEEEEDEDESQS